MNYSKQLLRGLLIGALVLLLTPDLSSAQCAGQCGDVDNNGSSNVTDIELLGRWLQFLEPPPGELGCGDVDIREGITENDIMWYWGYIYGGAPLFCPPTAGPLVPIANSDYGIVHNTVFPAGKTTKVLKIGLRNRAILPSWRGLSAPLEIRVDGEIPELSSLFFHWRANDEWGGGYPDSILLRGGVNPTGTSEGQLLLGLEALARPELPTGVHSVAQVTLTLPPSDVDRQITVGFCDVPAGNTPMVGDLFDGMYALDVEPCVIELDGNINGLGGFTSADIIYLVNYIFKSGPAPLPIVAAADVNCDEQVTTADILALVGQVFKAWPLPCEVCAK